MCDSESVWINSNMLQLVNFCLLFGLPKLRVFQMTAKKLSDGNFGSEDVPEDGEKYNASQLIR